MIFNTYLPNTPDHALVKKTLEEERQKNPNGFNYAAVIAHYNTLPRDSIFTLPLRPDKRVYLIGRLTAAGLQQDIDYLVDATEVEADDGSAVKELVITKVSNKDGASLNVGSRKRSPEAIAQALQTRQNNAATKAAVAEAASKVVSVAKGGAAKLPRATAPAAPKAEPKAAPTRKKPPKK